MNQNELIAMAKEARISEMGLNIDGSIHLLGLFERFAALVAAKEREACAQVCASEEARALYNFDNDLEANRPFWNGGSQVATSCEASIRARSKP